MHALAYPSGFVVRREDRTAAYATGWNILVALEVPASLTVSAAPEPRSPLVRTAFARFVTASRPAGGSGVDIGPKRTRLLIFVVLWRA